MSFFCHTRSATCRANDGHPEQGPKSMRTRASVCAVILAAGISAGQTASAQDAPSAPSVPETTAPAGAPPNADAVPPPAPVAAPPPTIVMTPAPVLVAPPPPPEEPLAGFSNGTAFMRAPDNAFVLFPNGRIQNDGYF